MSNDEDSPRNPGPNTIRLLREKYGSTWIDERGHLTRKAVLCGWRIWRDSIPTGLLGESIPGPWDVFPGPGCAWPSNEDMRPDEPHPYSACNPSWCGFAPENRNDPNGMHYPPPGGESFVTTPRGSSADADYWKARAIKAECTIAQPEETRVVLVKPGDVLVVGNVRHLDEKLPEAMKLFRETTGITLLICHDDVSISTGGLASLLQYCRQQAARTDWSGSERTQGIVEAYSSLAARVEGMITGRVKP